MTSVRDVTPCTVGAILRSLPPTPTTTDVLWNFQGAFGGDKLCGQKLIAATVDPSSYAYHEVETFKNDWLAVNLLSKADFVPTGYDKKARALAKWELAEESCGIMNRCGRMFSEISPRRLERAIQLAREIIAKTLGRLDLNEVAANARFSGGASTSGKRRRGHPYHKYQRKLDVTYDCLAAAVAAVQSDQQWFYATVLTHGADPLGWFRVVEGARWDTVPKNSGIDRVICIEPDMNMYLQKGAGSVIRQRLKGKGINLNSQWLNQHYAWIGSRTGSLATLDLSNASDTISIAIVQELLPPEWFDFLCVLRSGSVLLPDGKWRSLEKMSSMGNGYTFELETLIFWALSRAVLTLESVQDERLAVYGDDIVIHHEAVAMLTELLTYCGFTVNEGKSFVTGPFRESCGKHYFCGIEVTPFRISAPINTLAQMYWLHNSYSFWSGYAPNVLRKYLSTRIPKKFRLHVPISFGLKAGLHEPMCDVKRPRWKQRYQTYEFVYLAEITQKHRPNGWASLHTQLGYSAPDAMEFTIAIGEPTFAFKRTLVSPRA